MTFIILAWLSAVLRWTHAVAGIAWIGSSFYFIAADLSLRKNEGLAEGVHGETWQVHGGGFYHIQKYLVAPARLPADLTWFKWESYSTWLFGFLLLVSTYYLNPTLYLIDPAVCPLAPWQAVAASLASLAVGWLIYDGLCRSPLGNNILTLAIATTVLILAMSELYLHLFGARAAFLHVGALTGSFMTGNVFFLIIPNQKKVVAALLAGKTPDPTLGAQAKKRSLHNNYLTLPVVFLMLSNHYPMAFGGKDPMIVLVALFTAGGLVRHVFNMHHAGQKPFWWLFPAAAVAMGVAAFSSMPNPVETGKAVSFTEVAGIIDQRCHACHAAKPTFEGIAEAPKGVMFDSAEQILAKAEAIRQQVVIAKAMPLGNATGMTENERAAIASWLADGAKGP